MATVAVIDFETTGLSPAMGDRATEVGAVIVEDGKIVDRYQSLMNAGIRIPAFIEAYTGISNEMIAAAPKAAQVSRKAPTITRRSILAGSFGCPRVSSSGWHGSWCSLSRGVAIASESVSKS